MKKVHHLIKTNSFELNRVTDTKTGKKWHSIYVRTYGSGSFPLSEIQNLKEFLGPNYRYGSYGMEWRFRNLALAQRKFSFAILRWS